MPVRRSRDLIALLAVGVAVSMVPILAPDAGLDTATTTTPALPTASGDEEVPRAAPSAGGSRRVMAQPVLEADRPIDRGVVAPRPRPSGPEVSSAPTSAPAPSAGPAEEILARELTGEQLLRRDEQLPEIAERNRIAVPRLRALLAGDETVYVNTRGRVYFVDPRGEVDEHASDDHGVEPTDSDETVDDGPLSTAESAAAALGAAPALSRSYPTSETFRLNSNPAATRTIFIDADGATVSGTAWNASSNRNPIPNGTWAGYNREGSPSNFTDAEHAWVQEVWRQVAETYAAFDVNVTTQDRGAAAYVRSSSSDSTYGSRVVLTTSDVPAQAACQRQCLGVAYIGTFGDTDSGRHQPAWVFLRGTESPTIAAQAVAHEVGHNLNLGHDAKPGSSYYAGTSAWGPIMGAAMQRAVSHWSKGEYADPSNREDDLAVMQQQGLPLRADDHGNTLQSATNLGAAPAYDVEGVISSRNDQDVLRLRLGCETTLQAAATGIGAQTTLDLKLDLLDGAGNALATHAPPSGRSNGVSTGMNAALSRTVGAGTYYLRVDGVGSGSGSIAQGTGWSDYASLGRYRLTATGCPDDASPGSGAATSPSPYQLPTPSPGPTTAPAPLTTTAPSAPRGAVATSGRRGRPVTATLRWTAPARNGGAAVTGYRVNAYQLAKNNRVRATFRTATVASRTRVLQISLPQGRYAFAVQAINAVGSSPWSARSKAVRAR